MPEHADVAVRRGLADATGFSAHPFMPEALLPVFGAGLRGRDDIRAPADLARTTWLTATMRPDDWQRWLAKAGLIGLSPARWVTFDHTNLALGAAMDGLGVAIAPAFLIEGELRTNRLIAPFPELMAPDDGYYVLCRMGQENKPPVRRSGNGSMNWGRRTPMRCRLISDASLERTTLILSASYDARIQRSIWSAQAPPRNHSIGRRLTAICHRALSSPLPDESPSRRSMRQRSLFMA